MPKVRSNSTHSPRLGDLTPDPQNANLGTARGREALAQSLREFGPGRAVLIDRHGNIIAGNKTVEEPKRLNIPLQVVKTDGQVLVAVQREDLDLITDPRAKRLAIADTGGLDQPFNTFPKYWRRLSLARLPLIDDGFSGRANASGQARLRESEPRTKGPKLLVVIVRDRRQGRWTHLLPSKPAVVRGHELLGGGPRGQSTGPAKHRLH